MDESLMVSIQCLAYNHKKYIRQCLDGFVMQKTNFRFEAIVHDDASDDGTSEIIREYADRYPNIIKPIYETENLYSRHDGSLRRVVQKKLSGKYIALCEGDDYWIDPLKLQKQVDFLEANPDYGICITDFDKLIEEKGVVEHALFETQPEQYRHNFKDVGDFITFRGYVAPPTWLFRRELYFSSENFINSVDGTFVWFSYFLAKSKVHYIPDVTAVYRVLAESASHSPNYEKMYHREKNILETQIKLIDMYGLDDELKQRCKKNYYRNNLFLFAIYGKRQDVEDAKKVLGAFTAKQRAVLCVASTKIGRSMLISLRNWKNSRK